MTLSGGESVRGGSERALEQVLEATGKVLDALLAPYEALSDARPDTPVGAPVPVPDLRWPPALRLHTEEAVRGGRPGWALREVEAREPQVRDLLARYREGAFRDLSVAEWVGKVREFQDAILSDVHTAMQAPKGWDRLTLGGPAATPRPDPDALTPPEAARELRLSEKEVRRRIREGTLGPWRKEGNRWVVGREEFLRHWSERLLAEDLPQPPATDGPATGEGDRLLHLRVPAKPARKGKPRGRQG